MIKNYVLGVSNSESEQSCSDSDDDITDNDNDADDNDNGSYSDLESVDSMQKCLLDKRNENE